jgi:2-oxoglutarate/2-oxoacid ferredoxin oxidoreductase subunit beta
MTETTHMIHKYLRSSKKFPHIWCAGCGDGIVLGALIRAIEHTEYSKDDIVLISGIGCSGRLPVYVDFNTLHTTHGRALTFATGIKLAKPSLKVIVVMGDGDATAIGGNHLIHAARRNIDVTAIIINNETYGMTGGQTSPTTPFGMSTSSNPYGNVEKPFDICKLVEAAGAPFVARSTVYHTLLLEQMIDKALAKKGFSVVEVIAPCVTYFGKQLGIDSPVGMMQWQKDNAVKVEIAKEMKEEELRNKIVIGVLVEKEIPSYLEELQKIQSRIKHDEV